MDLIEELKKVMEERGFSADTMSKFIGCSSRQVDRWIRGESKPTHVYQILIKKGIKKVNKL
jgi:transcriptional regulator with XRE-family HTH domain